jgi:hypothetical protein
VPAIAIFGDTVFAVRITLALIAIAAVPLLYALVRVTIGRAEAFFASALLAVMYWHLLYSRVAHWSISYGTVLLAVLLCLALACGRCGCDGSWPAGCCSGWARTPTTSTPSPAALTAALGIVTAVRYRDPADRRRWLRALAWFYGVALVAALPMIAYVANPDSYYWTHVRDYREAGLLRSDEFREASPPRKAGLVAEQAWSFVSTYTYDADPDTVDANGQRPVFDIVMLLLLAAGVPFAIARRREPMIIAALCCLIIILPAVLQRGSVMRSRWRPRRTPRLALPLPFRRRALAAEAAPHGAIAGVCWRWPRSRSSPSTTTGMGRLASRTRLPRGRDIGRAAWISCRPTYVYLQRSPPAHLETVVFWRPMSAAATGRPSSARATPARRHRPGAPCGLCPARRVLDLSAISRFRFRGTRHRRRDGHDVLAYELAPS